MPRIFSYKEFCNGSETVRKYADKHSPVIICRSDASRNEPFKIKVKIGSSVMHPNTDEHHFEYIQLWNLETLIGEARLDHKVYGNNPLFIEQEFTIIPKVSLRLTAMAYCNKHGLWSSGEIFVQVKD
jgi:superoxide reductase